MGEHGEFARARRGDLDALEAIYARLKEPLYAYLARLVGDDHEAEDLLAETFIHFVRAMDRFRDDSDPGRLLFTIARRQSRMFRRKRRWSVLAPEPKPPEEPALPWEKQADNPARRTAAHEEQEQLLAAVRDLPPRPKSLFILVDLLGKSYEEAAAIEGITVGAAHRAAARARARLLDHPALRPGPGPDTATDGARTS